MPLLCHRCNAAPSSRRSLQCMPLLCHRCNSAPSSRRTHPFSLSRAWAVAWAVLATRMWTPDSGQRPLQQREINDRQQLVKERRLQRTVRVWCVCGCQKTVRVSALCHLQRWQCVWHLQRWHLQRWQVCFPHICHGLDVGSYWCLCLSACTPLDKRARHASRQESTARRPAPTCGLSCAFAAGQSQPYTFVKKCVCDCVCLRRVAVSACVKPTRAR